MEKRSRLSENIFSMLALWHDCSWTYFFIEATAGVCNDTSRNPSSCSCLSLWPWFLNSFTSVRSVSTIYDNRDKPVRCTNDRCQDCSLCASKFLTIISRLISKIKGINTTIEVDARNSPQRAPCPASHHDQSFATPPAWLKDAPARWRNPFIPPTSLLILDCWIESDLRFRKKNKAFDDVKKQWVPALITPKTRDWSVVVWFAFCSYGRWLDDHISESGWRAYNNTTRALMVCLTKYVHDPPSVLPNFEGNARTRRSQWRQHDKNILHILNSTYLKSHFIMIQCLWLYCGRTNSIRMDLS